MLAHIDLFSGIGGFALAARWCGIETVAFCEIDKFCQRVLAKNFPGVPIYDDVHTFPSDKHPRPFLLTGGFPCQPYSVAGLRRGAEDDRALWPAMLEVIKATKPTWVLGENVAGFVSMGLDEYISDMEVAGYETRTFIIPACAVGASHRRNRTWIVSYDSCRENGVGEQGEMVAKKKDGESIYSTTRLVYRDAAQSPSRWESEPSVGRMVYGVPPQLDRLKSLGNSIVPQVAYEIIRGIVEASHRGKGE